MVHLNCRGIHQALDAFGDGHVIGIGIVGIDRRGVGGGHHHLAALRLGVPGFANVGDQGKIGNAGNAINRNDADGAALGLQANGLYAGFCRHNIAPGAGGIDEDFGFENSLRGNHFPDMAGAQNCFGGGAVQQLAAARFEQLEIAAVQQVHVEIAGVGIEKGAFGIAFTEDGKMLEGLGF